MIAYNLPAGKLKVFTITGTNNILFLALRPDQGTRWRVISARARTDEGASGHVGAWEFDDGSTQVPISEVKGYGAAVAVYFHVLNSAGVLTNSIPACPWISYRVYLNFRANAIDAGKKIFIDAVVEEVVGLEARI